MIEIILILMPLVTALGCSLFVIGEGNSHDPRLDIHWEFIENHYWEMKHIFSKKQQKTIESILEKETNDSI